MKKKKTYQGIITLLLIFCSLFYAYYLNAPEKIVKDNNNISKRVIKETDPNDYLKIYYLDVGQADSILIDCSGKYMLIDAGNNEDGKLLVNYFNNLGIKKFDYVVATHPHEDHIGGMDDIINNFSVDNFYMPDVITTTKTYEDLLTALENKNQKVTVPNIDDKFNLNSCNFNTIYTGTNEKNLNETSIVLKLNYLNNNFLFMGDASSKVEKEIITKDVKSDVIKIGHHGSQYSSSLEFLEKVNPKYAIISVEKNNNYHHPHDIVLDRLNKLDIKVYRTDLDGTILLTSNGNEITFEKLKTNTNG